MNRNRPKKSVSKQSPISSISSHVSLLTTNKNNETYLLTQALLNSNVTTDIHSLLQPLQMNTNRESKRSRTVFQPKGTISYTVGNNDTLEKVALRFNSTPSELIQLNKLSTRMVFPTQVLFVPEKGSSDNSDQQQTTNSPSPEISSSALTKPKDEDVSVVLRDRRLSGESSPPSNRQSQQDVGPMVWSITRQTATRPGHAQRLKSDSSTENEPSLRTIEKRLSIDADNNNGHVRTMRRSLTLDENHELDDECLQRFIKINVRLITEDRQSVAGTLLVTPNAVMFDPDVLDPLTKEHGIDKYGLIIQMDLLAGIVLYEDLSMYQHEASVRDEEKRKMYHSTSVKNVEYNQSNTPLNTDEEQIHDLIISLLDKIDKELNLSTSTDTCCMLFNASSTVQRQISKNFLDNNNNDDKTFRSISTDDIDFDNLLEVSNDLFQPDDYKHSVGILRNDNNDNENIKKSFNRIPSQISYVFDWTKFKRAVRIKQGYHLENCVPPDHFNKRFDEIDKLLYQQQQTYFAPHPIIIPYYLRIKTSMHIHDIPSLYARKYKRPSEKISDKAFGEKTLENEYWFSVPKDKIDHLYSFFLLWTPERESNALNSDEENESTSNDNNFNKGFVLLATDDPELTGDYLTIKNQRKNNNDEEEKTHYLKRQNTLIKEWEIISVNEIYQRFHGPHSNDANHDHDIQAPKLLHPSTLINEEQTKQILIELPARIHALNWYMTFSTETHGFSLNQLYRRSIEFDHDLPSLLIVKDVDQNVFGAFVPHQLMISESVYGTGESFLFTFYPKFQAFNWTHSNELYCKGDTNALGFGIADGAYGLWLDADLYHGRTCPSKTFNNEMLTTNEDFIIASVEVWTFTN